MLPTRRIRRLGLLLGTLTLVITLTRLTGNAFIHSERLDQRLLVMQQATDTKIDQHNSRRFQRSEVNSTVKKIIIFAYMRGGSSLAGEMFNRNPDAMLWYEPLDHFYSALFGTHIYSVPGTLAFWNNGTRRAMSPTERRKLTAFIGDLLSCNYANLPVESLSHIFLNEPLSMARYAECFLGASHSGPPGRARRGNGRAGTRKRPARSLLSTNSQAGGSHGFGGWSDLFNCKAALKPICGLSVEDAIRAKCPEMIDLTRSIWRQGNATMGQVMAAMERAQYQLGNKTHRYARSFLDHQLCLARIRDRVEICRPLAEQECRRRKVQVLELVRVNMADVREVLVALPDVRVIYHTRDPRAVVLSRVTTNLMRGSQLRENTSDAVTEAEYLCRKMALDIEARQALEAEDPGSVFTMTYENLVRDPLAVAERVYGFVGSQLPADSWSAFVRTNMYGGKSDGKFGISRKDASKAAFQWKETITYASIEPLTAVCRHVLNQLNYTHWFP